MSEEFTDPRTDLEGARRLPCEAPSSAAGSSAEPAGDIYRRLFTHAPLGIAQVSREGRFMEVNPHLCEMLGYGRDDLLGRHITDVTCFEDVDLSLERLRQINAGEVDRLAFEKRYLHRDGRPFWINLTAAAVRDAHGRVGSYVSFFEDINEKKVQAEALERGLRKYRTVIETTTQGFWMIDLEGRLLEVNEAYCRLSGYSRAELLGMRIAQLEAEQSPADVAGRISRVLREGASSFDTQHRRKDGSTIYLRATVAYDRELGDRMFALFHDLSDADEAAAELKAAHDEQRSLINALPDVVVFKDGDGRWRLVNERARFLLGLDDGDWLGRTDAELAAARPRHRELHVALGQDDAAVWRGRKLRVAHFTTRAARGEDVTLEIRKLPVFGADGGRHSMLVLAREISDLERALEQKRIAEERGEVARRRALDAESALVSVSEYTLRKIGDELHDDFGQLLTGSAMLADSIAHNLAQSRPDDAATARRLAALLNEAVGKTRRLSHGLHPGELDAGSFVPLLRSLTQHLHSTSLIKARFTQRGSEFALGGEQALHLYRIVQEATSNVIRHSGAKAMSVSINHRNGVLTVTITDNGFGVLNDRRKTVRTGLGLKTMQHRAELIGATFRIEKPKQGGTRVKVTLALPEPRA